MGGSSKASSARQESASMQGRTEQEAYRRAQEQIAEAGRVARQQMTETSQPTGEETGRLERYKGKAITPAETLVTQQGPIAQAVARRVQERAEQPGLDYQTQSPAFAEGVSLPLWRALKARGIVPPPGAEGGGGLATQQYMKGAVPALAELRQRTISEDIGRGQQYGQSAQGLQDFFTNLEANLGEAIRSRLFQGGMEGARYQYRGKETGVPYGIQSAIRPAQINREEVEARYGRKEEQQTAMGEMLGRLALAVATKGMSEAGAPSERSVRMPKGSQVGSDIPTSPYDIQLAKRLKGAY